VEEILLGNFLRFCVVRDENNLNILITRANELIEDEKETPGEILLHGVHGT
jgi:hypothetical protein